MNYLLQHILIILLTLHLLGLKASFGAKLTRKTRKFPVNFKFGTATSSYQIEGGWDANGRGPSIWDTFTHNFPERIADGSNADVTSDSYHLYKKDVAVQKNLGVNFYRFSFSWSRILPTGEISSLNLFGVQYYHRLIDELIQNGIEPIATIYHWDLPQYLQDLGGWTNPLISNYFESFTNVLFREYGAKIKKWITFNEPHSFCGGYAVNVSAPGVSAHGVGDYLCTHHMLISHARAYHLYRNKYYSKFKGLVGITLDAMYSFPYDANNKDDIEIAQRTIQFELGLYAHPIFSMEGDYPAIVREVIDKNSANEGREWSRLPKFTSEMVKYIRGTADFFGLNYYTSRYVRPLTRIDLPNPSRERDTGSDKFVDPKWPKAKSVWLYSVPKGLFSMLVWIKKSYGNVGIMITENGWSDNGELEDDGRIEYLNEHFNAILDAIDAGVNVTGHTTWSLIDNFEWNHGYTEKFGVFQVDRKDPHLTRIPKNSSFYLERVFKTKQIIVKHKNTFLQEGTIQNRLKILESNNRF